MIHYCLCRTPDIGWNAKENKGMAFNYFTYGCAATVVEIDCLSGDHQVIRKRMISEENLVLLKRDLPFTGLKN